MRNSMTAVAVCTAALTVPAVGQVGGQAPDPAPEYHTPTFPVGQSKPYPLDSGLLANLAEGPSVVFSDTVHVIDSNWLRLYFGETQLAPGSFVRVTSLLDGEVQELDTAQLQNWSYSTAYFNGDSVLVELVAAPKSDGNRLVIDSVDFETEPAVPVGAGGQCGICGPTDDRVPSSELWTARLFPAGCTASVYNTDSCMVTAGHCIGGSMVVQFNVPASNPNCSTNNPPIADQFPASATASTNGGVGNDWGVMTTGTNNLGEQPYDRYGVLRPIAAGPAGVGAPVSLTGYGVDLTCVRTLTQQTAVGTICTVGGTLYTFNVDLRGGNSGSALIHNDEIIGIATHCPCCNVATRVDLAAFEAAHEACPPAPPTPIATGTSSATDGFLLVSPDEYGSWAVPFGGGVGNLGDLYNPAGAAVQSAVAFTSGLYLFAGSQRELLTTSGDWQGTVGADNSLVSQVTSENVASDTSGNGVDDTVVSSFQVGGGQTALEFDLVQHVESVTAFGSPAALLTQEYTITNVGGSPIDFTLVRVFDGDMTWSGDFSNDSVGTGTNGSPDERYVYERETANTAQSVTLSSASGTAYAGSKNGVDPDGPGGSPPYGFGTDTQIWDAFGLPSGWQNHIAGVGYDTNGESGAAPPGSVDPRDGMIALEIPVSLEAGPGPGSTTTVVIHHTYGASAPIVPVLPCPWDCQAVPDGDVGILDFLDLLAQWGGAGTCDFDGGGVGILDFLALLANWGPCP